MTDRRDVAAELDLSPVQRCIVDDLLVVTIDNPPVNALGRAVREGLLLAAQQLDAEARLRAMVLRSTGKVFIGGADIREFSGPRLEPLLPDVCDRLEACRKPIVAAMHGDALGGGLEVALASHARVASPAAQIAFPEVLLGLLPGAGGTQRAPRLCGAALALELMLTGRRLAAHDALAAGLIDEIAADVESRAMELARSLAANTDAVGAPLRRARDGRALDDVEAQRSAVASAHATMSRDPAYLFARERIVRCVSAAVEQPYEQGAAVASAAFLECLASPEREMLVQRFFAERAARRQAAPPPSGDRVGTVVAADGDTL